MEITNSKLSRSYAVNELYEAGIELTGGEVKSVKAGRMSLGDSYARIKEGQAYLVNAYIAPYMGSKDDPHRQRRLLMKKKELSHLIGEVQSGLTLVPKKVYNKGPWIKVQLALAKGKKQYEKRDDLRKKAVERDIERTLRDAKKRYGDKTRV